MVCLVMPQLPGFWQQINRLVDFKIMITMFELIRSKRRCHLMDLRNHGKSFQNPDMSYIRPLLLGQSMGGKLAMTYASLMPEEVEGVISIDSPPIDRNDYPHMNIATNQLIQRALKLDFSNKTYKQAVEYLQQELSEDRAFASSLAMCLDRNSQQQANLQLNLEAFAKNEQNLYDFKVYGQYKERHGDCLMIVGKDSFQYEIEHDVKHYQSVFPDIKQENIKIIEGAGHWVHAEKKDEVLQLISDFIDKIDQQSL
eukprot:403360245